MNVESDPIPKPRTLDYEPTPSEPSAKGAQIMADTVMGGAWTFATVAWSSILADSADGKLLATMGVAAWLCFIVYMSVRRKRHGFLFGGLGVCGVLGSLIGLCWVIR